MGAVLFLAALWTERRLVQAASVAALIHAVPHLLFHLGEPHEALTSLDTVLSNGGLALNAVVALAVLVAVTRVPSRPGAKTTAATWCAASRRPSLPAEGPPLR